MPTPARIKFAHPIPYNLTEGTAMNKSTLTVVERSYLLTMQHVARELRQLIGERSFVEPVVAKLNDVTELVEKWCKLVQEKEAMHVLSGPVLLATPPAEQMPNVPLDAVGTKLVELGVSSVISFRHAVWGDGDVSGFVCTIAKVSGQGHTAQLQRSGLAAGETPSVAFECALREWDAATAKDAG
jgi:hypothetical protein